MAAKVAARVQAGLLLVVLGLVVNRRVMQQAAVLVLVAKEA